MGDYISREAAIRFFNGWVDDLDKQIDDSVNYPHLRSDYKVCKTQLLDCIHAIKEMPAADVVEEENILKFYYVRSIDEYWIGRRLDTLYYARYEAENQQWVWAYSRYLPWGEHVVSPTSLWKEHTYPSEPEEISFTDWLKGFSQKYVAAKGRPVVHGEWKNAHPSSPLLDGGGPPYCSVCGKEAPLRSVEVNQWKLERGSLSGPEVVYKTECFLSNFCPSCGADMRGPNLDTTKGESH